MDISFVLALGFGRLRGPGLPDELSQELKLGEEELPDDVPTCRTTETTDHILSVLFSLSET